MIESRRERLVYGTLVNSTYILFCAACLVPFLLVVAISFSSESDIMADGYRLIPRQIDLTAYRFVFETPDQIIQSYKVSLFVSLFGTAVSVFVMLLAAYPLSRTRFRYRGVVMFIIFFTMLFSGGLVPTYILITRYLRLGNTIWVLIIPGLVNAWTIIIMRSFCQKIPESIFESAKIDGANEMTIFLRLVIPLSKPLIATMALLGVLSRWNDWFTALLYIRDESLFPLQYLLQRIMRELRFLADLTNQQMTINVADIVRIPTESMRMAMAVVAAGPMLLIFPFFQRYFVKGMTVGSIKG
ncbi:MAG: carbohydrate ABC transporter permease [Spirochaetales bacterium]